MRFWAIKTQYHCELLLLVPAQFISELLIKLNTVFSMIFIILTPDSQSTLSSFSLFLSFVTNSPVAKKALSGSTDLGLVVIKAWNSFSRLFLPLLCSLKKTHFLYHNWWSDLFLCRNSFVVFTLVDSVLWFQMFDQTVGAWTTSFCMTEHKLHFGVGWASLQYKKCSKLLIFFDC